MNLVQAVWAQADRHPDAPALLHSSQSLGYGALREAALLVALHLQRSGIRPGDRVAVAPDNPAMQVLCLLALAHLGAVSAPAYRDMPLAQWQRLVRDGRVRALVFSPAGAVWPEALRAEVGLCLPDAGLLAPVSRGVAAPAMAAVEDGTVWRLVLSSGTTGEPTLVERRHGLQCRLAQGLEPLVPCGPGTRLLCFADLAISMTQSQLMCQLHAGGAVVLPDGADPGAFVQAVQQHQATHALMSGWSASLLAQAAATWPAGARPCPSLRSLMVGGAPLPPHAQDALLRHVCHRIQNNYGASEIGPLAFGWLDPASAAGGSTGQLTPWAEGQAVDADDQPLPPGQPGRLRFRSALLPAGADAPGWRGGWFYPGDWGHVDAQGLLYVQARQDELINVGGLKLNPLVLEALIGRQPGVAACAVVGLARPTLMLVAAVVPAAGADTAQLPAALRQACLAELSPWQVPTAWVLLPQLPRTPQGKLQRALLVQQLEQDAQRAP